MDVVLDRSLVLSLGNKEAARRRAWPFAGVSLLGRRHDTTVKLTIVATVVICLVTCFASEARGQTWTIETLAPDTDYFDFAIDGPGTLHVLRANVAPPGSELVYEFNAGAGWQSEVVPKVPAPSLISLVVDASGKPRIAFLDTTSTIHYGYRDGGTWVIEALQPATLPFNPGLALDPSGEPHIAYISQERIRYAYKLGGVWTDEEVIGSWHDDQFARAAIAIDPSGVVRIGSWRIFAGAAFFTRGTSSWTYEIFGQWGYMPWMELDGDGHAHFVYYGGSSGIPSYGTNESSVWVTESVDVDGDLADNDIALDSSGDPYIAHTKTYAIRYEAPNFYYHTDIYFAYRAGGVWRREVVDSAHDYSGSYWAPTRIAFDGSNTPHVVYFDPKTRELKHGTRTWPTAVGGDALPETFGIVSVTPNPFNPSTTITYRLLVRSQVQVAVYDVRGRRLRVLSDELRGPGVQHDSWDGLDDRGEQVASGVYFVKVVTPKRADVRRAVLLK